MRIQELANKFGLTLSEAVEVQREFTEQRLADIKDKVASDRRGLSFSDPAERQMLIRDIERSQILIRASQKYLEVLNE